MLSTSFGQIVFSNSKISLMTLLSNSSKITVLALVIQFLMMIFKVLVVLLQLLLLVLFALLASRLETQLRQKIRFIFVTVLELVVLVFAKTLLCCL